MRQSAPTRRMLGVALVALVSALFCQATHADEFPRTTLGRAASCYYALDYDCVVKLLESLPDDYPPAIEGQLPGGLRPLDLPLLLEAGRILAVAQLALGDEPRAREVFAWLLEIDPEFLVTGTEVPPRFLAVFYEVRARVLAPPLGVGFAVRGRSIAVARGRVVAARGTATRVAALPPDPGELPRKREALRVSVGAGSRWVALTRGDASVYDGALGFVGGGRIVFDERWVAGVEVGASVHEVALDNLLVPTEPELRVLTVAAQGGYHQRVLEGVAVEPSLSLGLATWGVSAWAQRSGPAFGAQVAVPISWLRPVYLSLEAGAVAVTPLQGDARTSVLLRGGLNAGAVF